MDRDFKGIWIPKDIWLDTRLNALDKVILMEVDSLDQGENGCFAGNQHIADFCQCSQTKVSTSISKLVKFGYLYVKEFDGRKRILKSSLSKFERQTFNNCEADSQNLKDSNTYRNTPRNTSSGKGFTPPTVDEVREYCKQRGNRIDAEYFCDYYQRQKWKLSNGINMSDWRAAIRTWERKDRSKNVGANGVALSDEPIDPEFDRLF